jgi:hypothetical protein
MIPNSLLDYYYSMKQNMILKPPQLFLLIHIQVFVLRQGTLAWALALDKPLIADHDHDSTW